MNNILVIDNSNTGKNYYSFLLELKAIEELFFSLNEKKIMDILEQKNIKAVIFDIQFTSTLPAPEVITAIRLIYPKIPVIIYTELNDLSLSVECMKIGSYDYIIKKDQNKSKLASCLVEALNLTDSLPISKVELLRNDIESLNLYSKELENNSAFSGIITQNNMMMSVFAYCTAISSTTNTVLITGETGTGKELIANSIHLASKRNGNFVACNVVGLDDQLFSDALFGHVKGAFTGALSNRPGLIDKAKNGTLFLDEIGDLSLSSQVKLLRLIQEKEYSPLGSDNLMKTNAQIIVATNKKLKDLTNEDKFREDLFYRLITHYIQLPSLKERIDDIKILLDHFIETFSRKYNRKKPSYHISLLTLLQNYTFPGNIRELKSMIEDSIVNHSSKILSSDLIKKHIDSVKSFSPKSEVNVLSKESIFSDIDSLPNIKTATDMLIQEALRRCENNQSQAARLLNISHQALSKRLKDKNKHTT